MESGMEILNKINTVLNNPLVNISTYQVSYNSLKECFNLLLIFEETTLKLEHIDPRQIHFYFSSCFKSMEDPTIYARFNIHKI